MQILRKRLEFPNRSGIAFGGDRHVDAASANVDARRVRADCSRTLADWFPSGTLGSHLASCEETPANGPGRADVSLLNGIVRLSPHVTTECSTEPSTRLIDGLEFELH
jgi:hypothetical protein